MKLHLYASKACMIAALEGAVAMYTASTVGEGAAVPAMDLDTTTVVPD